MKKIFIIILSIFIIFSCGITKSTWCDIGFEGSYIEFCRDTVKIDQLDSVMISNNINTELKNWSNMDFYTPEKEKISQYTYVKSDTVYVISEIDSTYIFTGKCINKQ